MTLKRSKKALLSVKLCTAGKGLRHIQISVGKVFPDHHTFFRYLCTYLMSTVYLMKICISSKGERTPLMQLFCTRKTLENVLIPYQTRGMPGLPLHQQFPGMVLYFVLRFCSAVFICFFVFKLSLLFLL